jgi:hypothetical protein
MNAIVSIGPPTAGISASTTTDVSPAGLRRSGNELIPVVSIEEQTPGFRRLPDIDAIAGKELEMKKMFAAATVVAILAAAPVAQAADAKVTGLAGGAVAGAVVGGPVGAVIGGAAGLTIGAAVDNDHRRAVIVKHRHHRYIEERAD